MRRLYLNTLKKQARYGRLGCTSRVYCGICWGPVAQGLEHVAYNDAVGGSIPPWPTMEYSAKVQTLIDIAAKRMRGSEDPIHGYHHAAGVAATAEACAQAAHLTQAETEALVLAAWWHDVGRTVLRRSSFVFMIFFDDLLSALMLWRETVRLRLFGSVAGMSTRLIFCHSFGTGRLFSWLLRPRTRFLLTLLTDADKIDILSTARLAKIHQVIAPSRLHRASYRFLAAYILITRHAMVKSEVALPLFLHSLREAVAWMHTTAVVQWHEQTFNAQWTKKLYARLNAVAHELLEK